VKKHPLLKTIEGWEFQGLGKAEVQQVDDGIAFAKVFEDDERNPIKRFHKLIQVEKKPVMAPLDPVREQEHYAEDGTQKEKPEYLQGEQPRMGWVGVGPWVGGLSREYNPYNGTGVTGGGMTIGGLADTQLWINREFFVSGALGYGFWKHTQSSVGGGSSSATGSATGTMTLTRLGGGYSYFLKEDFFGPKGWIKASYQNHSYSLPARTGDYLASASVNALAVGIGGDIPLREGWGMMMNLDIGVLNGGEAKNLGAGTVDGTSQLDFQLGFYTRIKSNMALRGTFEMWGDTITFVNGNSLSHRVISFSPSAVFFF